MKKKRNHVRGNGRTLSASRSNASGTTSVHGVSLYPSQKFRAALALAVSLWMANGVFWAPGVASAGQETEVTITSTADAEAKATAGTLGKKASLLPYNSYFLNTGTKMNITGEDCKNANFFAGYSDSEAGTAEANVSGYTLTVNSGIGRRLFV